MIIYISLLCAIVGLVVYLAAQNKVAEVGRILLWTGVLTFLLMGGHSSITWLK